MGDWHCGSEVGLKPPHFQGISQNPSRRSNENDRGLNAVQEKLWECVEELHKDVPKIDYLILNGDICDGTSERTTDLWTNKGQEQVMCAIEVIDYLKPRHLKVTQGTPYHTGSNPSLDAYVAAKAGGEYDEEYIFIPKGGGTSFHMKHYVGVSAKKALRSGGLAAEMDGARLRQSEFGPIDVVVRSHAHYFHSQKDADMEGLILPGMKGKDAYGRRGSTHYMPDLGYAVFHVGKSGYEWYPYVFNLKGRDVISVLT
jgi:hypothetical protein